VDTLHFSLMTAICFAVLQVFCPKNQELAQLLLDKNLITQVDDIPWLATALKRDVC